MDHVIAAMLSPAMGVAISPFPIMGLILLILGKNARRDSVSFVLGWMVGNGAIYTIALLTMNSVVEPSAAQTDQTMKIVHLLVAALLLFLAYRSVRRIPKKGQQVTAPKWLDKFENMGILGAFGVAIVLSAFNPVDMMFSLSAGVRVGALELGATQTGLSILLFVLLASCTVIAPTLIFLFAGRRMEPFLHKLYQWLLRNGELILTILFFVLAAESILKVL